MPAAWKSREIGTSAPTGGILSVDSIYISMSLVRLVGEKAMAQATGTAMIRPGMV